ncbi:MAG: valine--tRNA ligase [Pseudomonadota bacterium]
MDKTYQPQSIEAQWYPFWEKSGFFRPASERNSANNSQSEPYCIMIPPPNVTGSLHMGHAFQYTLMDCLIRWQRMKGRETLWQVGTDHAGIATQMVVERQLEQVGETRHTLGREAFLEKVWEWKDFSKNHISGQMRRLGISVDWSEERFTMDEGLSQAVLEVFVRLHEEGLIYRGQRLVNWDPQFKTAISDLEVVSEEEKGFLWHFKYPIEGGNDYLVVATTRPETMLGDTAVAVHPDDERYKHLIGKNIRLPLCDRLIPIIADTYVDPSFGSGCVKITPAHDFNDYEVGQRHQLPMINILTTNAHLNDEVPEAYRGLERFAARRKIVEDFKNLELLEKIEDHKLKVPRGDRSGVVIEPFLTAQWYVRVAPLAEPAIQAVESGAVEFVPKNWENTYFSWMRDIQDWCISRQLWWGHRIPAWYDMEGNVYVGRNEQEVREKHNLSQQLHQDNDVLDTWFSSALWTFSTLGWPERTERLKKFHPTQVLVTGFDIIFFWVARMIMMTKKFTGDIPFEKIYVHGLVRDAQGQKMSKSKGNVLDPIDLIDGVDLPSLLHKRTAALMQPQQIEKIKRATEKEFPQGIEAYGTDALRFTFCSLASTGRDIKFDLGRIEGYRNFCNKLWNACRYILMNTEDFIPQVFNKKPEHVVNQWILSTLRQTVENTEKALTEFRFDHAAQSLYDFAWHEFCDWFLELTKPLLTDKNSDNQAVRFETQQTLLFAFETVLRLAHPLMPFITEHLWHEIKTQTQCKDESIMLAEYPQAKELPIFNNASLRLQRLKNWILAIRNLRGELNISPAVELQLLFYTQHDIDRQCISLDQRFLQALTNVKSIQESKQEELNEPASSQWVDQVKWILPFRDQIDLSVEKDRLKKELQRTEQQKILAEKKLENPQFVDRAPADVVEKERQRKEEAEQLCLKIQKQIDELNGLASA